MKKVLKFSAVISLAALASAGSAQITTVIDHKDGSHTIVTTDSRGTFAERSNGGNQQSGGTDKETHDRVVREHKGLGENSRVIDTPSDGPANEGPANDGPAHDGPVRDGPTRDGPARDGPARDGPASDGYDHDRPDR